MLLSKSKDQETTQIKDLLAETYLEMNEEDFLYGFYKEYSTFHQTYNGFSYEKIAEFQEAKYAYSEVSVESLSEGFESQALKNGLTRYFILTYILVNILFFFSAN